MFFEENGVAIVYNPPSILEVNREVINMWSLIGHNVVRNEKKEIIGLEMKSVIPVLKYFNVPPEKANETVNDLIYITKIVHSVRQ